MNIIIKILEQIILIVLTFVIAVILSLAMYVLIFFGIVDIGEIFSMDDPKNFFITSIIMSVIPIYSVLFYSINKKKN
jgi:uncharacterized membrane protein